MAQLVTINQTAMQSGTMLGVRQVLEEWALPDPFRDRQFCQGVPILGGPGQ